jgi:hypothetical protein
MIPCAIPLKAALIWTMPALALWTVCGPPAVDAQESKPPVPTVLTIHPAKEPVPALKYRLVPERRELIPGNAAIFYHRACHMATPYARDVKREEKIAEWVGSPPGQIDRALARQHLNLFRNALHEAELGAFRLDCDWEFDRRDNGFALLLPEIQEIRQVGRLIVLKARLEILDGHPDEAIHWLEVGFAMSRHVSETPFLISGLVGDSIAGQLMKPLEDLIRTPGGPNLYWAFATRSRPLIEMRRAIEGERYILERELPELGEADGPAWSTEKARQFGDETFRKLRDFSGELRWISPAGENAGAGTPRLQDLSSRLVLAGIVARAYPEAKRSLIAEGRTLADIEAMPTLQVVLIHTLRQYSRFRDDVFKWTVFPYWQTRGRMDRVVWPHRTQVTKFANPLLTMFTSLMPAIENALLANARIERLLDALQCVEAIRIYAAEHDGALPESLDAMTETPVPIDPVTGKPFEYKKVDDATAILSASYPLGGPNHPAYMINYELKLAK